ncbi:hypothetical protein [Streptomyces sp. NPDC048527]
MDNGDWPDRFGGLWGLVDSDAGRVLIGPVLLHLVATHRYSQPDPIPPTP